MADMFPTRSRNKDPPNQSPTHPFGQLRMSPLEVDKEDVMFLSRWFCAPVSFLLAPLGVEFFGLAKGPSLVSGGTFLSRYISIRDKGSIDW